MGVEGPAGDSDGEGAADAPGVENGELSSEGDGGGGGEHGEGDEVGGPTKTEKEATDDDAGDGEACEAEHLEVLDVSRAIFGEFIEQKEADGEADEEEAEEDAEGVGVGAAEADEKGG